MEVVCPNCSQSFDLTIEPSEAEFVTDCEICCRPMNVVVRVSDGEIESVDVSPA